MGGIGIVNNPRARRNRRDPAAAGRLRALLGGEGEVLDASTPDELARAVERLRAAGVDLLGVNGGDGTNHKVLSALVPAWAGAPLPRLLPLRGGSMNTVAGGHGIRGTPEKLLARVLEARRRGTAPRIASRDLLRVSADGGAPLHGFIFGTGAIAAFIEEYDRRGGGTALAAYLLLARAALSALAGGPLADSLSRRDALRAETDGREWPDGAFLAFAAGSTPDIGLGFQAFHRCGEQPGFFHAVGITGTPAQVAWSLPRLRRGAPWRRRLAQDEVARALRLEGEGIRFIVDGDLYAAAGAITVETGPPVEILLP